MEPQTDREEIKVFNTETFKLEEKKDSKGNQKVILKGDAMPIGKTSRNGIYYRPESIKKAYKTLENVPFLFAHQQNEVRHILGKVEKVNLTDTHLTYEAEIDPEEKEFIRKSQRGYIKHVSVGAIIDPNTVEINEDEGTASVDVKEFAELSSAPVPGYKDTSALLNKNKEVIMLAEKLDKKEVVEKLKKEQEDTEDNSEDNSENKPEDNKEETEDKPGEREDEKQETKTEEEEQEQDDEEKTPEDQINELNTKLDELESKISEFENRVASVESKVDTILEEEADNPKDDNEDDNEDDDDKENTEETEDTEDKEDIKEGEQDDTEKDNEKNIEPDASETFESDKPEDTNQKKELKDKELKSNKKVLTAIDMEKQIKNNKRY